MRDNETLIEDVVTLGGNILGNLLGARHEMKAQAKQRMESVARHLDLVSRAEFDAAFAMLAKARSMQDDLADRLTAIEALLDLPATRKTKKAAKPNLPSVKQTTRHKKASKRS